MHESTGEDGVSTSLGPRDTGRPLAILLKQVFSLGENDLAAVHVPSNTDLKSALGRCEHRRSEEATDVQMRPVSR